MLDVSTPSFQMGKVSPDVKGLKEAIPVGVVAVDVLSLIPAGGDVVDGVLEFDANRSCHASCLAFAWRGVTLRP